MLNMQYWLTLIDDIGGWNVVILIGLNVLGWITMIIILIGYYQMYWRK